MQIHYFQRYHSKENVDTSNTMLMLSRLYNYNSDKFFDMLNKLFLNDTETPEIKFDLQVVGKKSVPDAIISQKSFKIVVETKLNGNFEIQQLINHLEQFGNENIKVLLTLDPKPMNAKFSESLKYEIDTYNRNHKNEFSTLIKHVHTTFEELIGAMEEIVDNRDIEILEVLEDYKKYCFEENLIPERHKWMRAIVTGTTLTDNIKYSLYYDDATRGYSDHGYIGLYSNKSIRAIGKLIKICEVSSKSGSVDDLCFDIKKGEKLTNEETENIKAAIIHAKEFDYDLPQVPHNFFIVDKFYPVDFYKKSKYPIQKSKYFNLAQMLKVKELGPTETIVKELNGKAWEEFE